MLRSLSAVRVNLPPLKMLEAVTGTCVSCRSLRRKQPVLYHIRSIPEERKTISQLDGMDLSQLQPQYRHVEALENAPEEVRRIFTLKFGSNQEKLESKYLEYAEQLQRHKHDYGSPEINIALMTVRIRNIQEDRTRLPFMRKKNQIRLECMVRKRNDLLLKLRSMNYERYCLVLKVLDLNLVYWPEYDVRLTRRVSGVIDMKERAFAEVQRRKTEQASRTEEVENLQKEILEKLKSGELVPQEEEEAIS